MIYLDYNATTPHDREVVEAMRPFIESEFGNPSSSHAFGRAPKRAIERAREQVAALIGARTEEVFFTGGGTESNNFAVLGSARALASRGDHIITTTIEHPAVGNPCAALEDEGFRVTRVPVGADGIVPVAEVEKAIDSGTILISIMHANNEIGTIQPIEEIGQLARRHGIRFHTDAAQSLGKIAVSVDELGVDMLTIAGHKLYAPKGIGAIYLRDGVRPNAIAYGGGQERGVRPGTENVMQIAGLGAAAEVARRDLERNAATMRETRDALEAHLSSRWDVRLNGHRDERLPNTLNVSLAGVTAQDVLARLADTVAASAGSACHADEVSISPVLQAIGVPAERARGTIRFSTGKYTTAEEVEAAAGYVIDAAEAGTLGVCRTYGQN